MAKTEKLSLAANFIFRPAIEFLKIMSKITNWFSPNRILLIGGLLIVLRLFFPVVSGVEPGYTWTLVEVCNFYPAVSNHSWCDSWPVNVARTIFQVVALVIITAILYYIRKTKKSD